MRFLLTSLGLSWWGLTKGVDLGLSSVGSQVGGLVRGARVGLVLEEVLEWVLVLGLEEVSGRVLAEDYSEGK